jgi:DNA-binding transcriptional ArsR family regulator
MVKEKDRTLTPLKDSDFSMVIKKTERLTAALYLVSNPLPGGDPLKCLLRDRGIALMRAVVSFTFSISEAMGRDMAIRNAHFIITEVLSCLEILLHSNSISSMNFRILSHEYSVLRELITASLEDVSPVGPEFSGDFFEVSSGKSDPAENERTPFLYGGISGYSSSPIGGGSVVDELAGRRSPSAKSTPDVAQKSTPERRKIILQIVSDRGVVTIKDIARRMTEYSEKTIQRELSALVREGALIKRGERRWSTYALHGTV